MFILNQAGTEIYNAEFMDHFLISKKQDAALIVASRGRDTTPYTIGRYSDEKEARDVLLDLFAALHSDESNYMMPLSPKVAEECTIRDARTKRKGGS